MEFEISEKPLAFPLNKSIRYSDFASFPSILFYLKYIEVTFKARINFFQFLLYFLIFDILK